MTKATVPATANNKAVPILTGTAMDTLRLRSACAWLSTGGASVVGGIVDFDGDDEEPLEGVVDPGKRTNWSKCSNDALHPYYLEMVG